MIEFRRITAISVGIVARSGGSPSDARTSAVIPVDSRIVARRLIAPVRPVTDGFPVGIPRIGHLYVRQGGIRGNREVAFRRSPSEPCRIFGIRHGKYDHIVRVRRSAREIFRRFGHEGAELSNARKRRLGRFRIRVVGSVFEKQRFGQGRRGYAGGRLHIGRDRSRVAHERPASAIGRHVAEGIERRAGSSTVRIDGIRSVRARRIGVLNRLAGRRHACRADERISGETDGRSAGFRTAGRNGAVRTGKILRIRHVSARYRRVERYGGRSAVHHCRNRIRPSVHGFRGGGTSDRKGRIRSVHERAGETGDFRIPNEADDGSAGLRRGKISRDYRHPGSGGDSGNLEIRYRARFVPVRHCRVERSYHEVFRIERGRGVFDSAVPDFEFFGVQFEFRVIGISCGIISARLVPVAAGQNRRTSVQVGESAGERSSGIVHYEVPRRVAGDYRF